jgi:hypothetical protein
MAVRDDYILRQIARFVDMALRAAGYRPDDQAEIEAAVQDHVGLPLDLIERLSEASLLDVLHGPDGLAAERALLVGLALRGRGAARGDEALRARGDRLVEQALAKLDLESLPPAGES